MNPQQSLLCVSVALLIGCSGDKSENGSNSPPTDTQAPQDTQDSGTAGPDWELILSSIGTTVAMPRFATMVTVAESMSTASQAFCAAPDAAGLTATQDAWHR